MAAVLTTITKTARTLVAAGTSNAAGSTTRGRVDLQTAHGGVLTIKMTNGATGPTVACQANVLVAHNAVMPAAASAGADWKTINSFSGGTSNNAVTEAYMEIGPGVMALEVEFASNTAQAVTVEAFFSEVTNLSSV
jgi:hypothetical protein